MLPHYSVKVAVRTAWHRILQWLLAFSSLIVYLTVRVVYLVTGKTATLLNSPLPNIIYSVIILSTECVLGIVNLAGNLRFRKQEVRFSTSEDPSTQTNDNVRTCNPSLYLVDWVCSLNCLSTTDQSEASNKHVTAQLCKILQGGDQEAKLTVHVLITTYTESVETVRCASLHLCTDIKFLQPHLALGQVYPLQGIYHSMPCGSRAFLHGKEHLSLR